MRPHLVGGPRRIPRGLRGSAGKGLGCLLELADALEPELPPVSCAHREVRWLRGDRNRQAIRCAQIDHCVRGLQFPSRACSRCGGCCGGRIRSDRVAGFNGSVNEFSSAECLPGVDDIPDTTNPPNWSSAGVAELPYAASSFCCRRSVAGEQVSRLH